MLCSNWVLRCTKILLPCDVWWSLAQAGSGVLSHHRKNKIRGTLDGQQGGCCYGSKDQGDQRWSKGYCWRKNWCFGLVATSQRLIIKSGVLPTSNLVLHPNRVSMLRNALHNGTGRSCLVPSCLWNCFWNATTLWWDKSALPFLSRYVDVSFDMQYDSGFATMMSILYTEVYLGNISCLYLHYCGSHFVASNHIQVWACVGDTTIIGLAGQPHILHPCYLVICFISCKTRICPDHPSTTLTVCWQDVFTASRKDIIRIVDETSRVCLVFSIHFCRAISHICLWLDPFFIHTWYPILSHDSYICQSRGL